MPIVKLDAIGSTNDFLSEMASAQQLENYTTVTTETQTKGRGQQGATWMAEPGKNLTVSVYIESSFKNPESVFMLNAAIALAIADCLDGLGIPDVCVKWPNDILSGMKKVSGVLIENSWRGSTVRSIVGIGLNVNQTDFGNLPHVASMALVTGRQFDRDEVLEKLLSQIKMRTNNVETKRDIWVDYHARLFKKDKPMPFESAGRRFMGIIRGVDPDGRLRVELEDESIRTFGVREISMLY
jgi:BirA family biotin operon repressor/biotin-[acetyl-CoA-carboxylase] ligase